MACVAVLASGTVAPPLPSGVGAGLTSSAVAAGGGLVRGLDRRELRQRLRELMAPSQAKVETVEAVEEDEVV